MIEKNEKNVKINLFIIFFYLLFSSQRGKILCAPLKGRIPAMQVLYPKMCLRVVMGRCEC